MPRLSQTSLAAPFVPRSSRRLALRLAGTLLLAAGSDVVAQSSPGSAPASIPAGAASPSASRQPTTKASPPALSGKALHQAEDAYVRGTRAVEHKDFSSAEREFAEAVRLNPRDADYSIALAVTRQHRLTDLIQRAAQAEKQGQTAEAASLLGEARQLDPENAVVRQHFDPDGQLIPLSGSLFPPEDPVRAQRAIDASGVGGPIVLQPAAGVRTFHTRGVSQELLTTLCSAFGLKAQFDPSVSAGPPIKFDLENVDFPTASRIAGALTHTFAVPLQPGAVFFAKDTPENRAQYQPLVEETLFIPGVTADALTDYANLARSVFNLKVVTAVGSAGGLVLRGDPDTLDRVNATFADLVDSGAEVMLDLTLYEVDHSKTQDIGTTTPSSVGAFPVAATAQNLINANQSLISAAIASNQLVLTGNPATDAINELALLIAAGVVSPTQFTNLLGVLGHYGGLPLAGIFLGSTTTFNALLNTTDVRILDTVKLRAGSGQDASFRAGSRYPIETGIYSSNASSSLTSAVAGLSINGTSVSSLLSQYLGSTSASVPQIQYEDLGLTLKATPQVLRSSDVQMKLDLKIEALGSGSINSIPILNNRNLVSQVTIPVGQTALLASVVTRSEQRAINGLPFLSELPGFQGTDKSINVATTELVITITPHVVRNRRVEVASKRLLMPEDPGARQAAP